MIGTSVGWKWKSKPPRGTGLDRSSRLARGLRAYWPLDDGEGYSCRDLSGLGNALAMNGTGIVSPFVSGPEGIVLNPIYDGEFVQTATPGSAAVDPLNITGPITVAARFQFMGNDGRIVSRWGGASNCWILYCSAGAVNLLRYTGAFPVATGATSLVPGRWYTAVGTNDGANSTVYLQGNPDGTTADPGSCTSAALPVAIGSETGGTNQLFSPLAWAAIWARALSAPEVASLSTDPYGLILPPPTRRFFAAAAVATTYTAPPSPTAIAAGSTTTATVTPDNPYTGTITGTPSGSASTGLAPVTLTFAASAAPQSASWTPTVNGTLTIAWTNGGSLTNPANGTITVSAAPLTAGAAAFDSCGPAGGSAFVKMTATDATGGTPTYAYQWQRKTGSGGTYSNLTNGSGVSGATTRSLTDGSATAGNDYFYRLNFTDSAGTPAAASSGGAEAQVYTGGALTGGATYKRIPTIKRGR